MCVRDAVEEGKWRAKMGKKKKEKKTHISGSMLFPLLHSCLVITRRLWHGPVVLPAAATMTAATAGKKKKLFQVSRARVSRVRLDRFCFYCMSGSFRDRMHQLN